MAHSDAEIAKKGRRTALVIAGTGVFWILATIIGGYLSLDQRVRALFDLIALGGFVFGLLLTYQLWRARRGNRR